MATFTISTELVVTLKYYYEKNISVVRSHHFDFFFNWDSLHARLNSHYEAWSYKKRSTKKITGYRKSV